MITKKIGFIGFGEVGRTFAQAMKTTGAEVYYSNGKDKNPEEGIVSLPFQDLFRQCDVILSTVPNHVAEEVAEKATPCLNSEKTYADMNSTSASVKKRIAQIIEPSHASFIEGAILSAVGEAGPKASILVSGEKAEEFSKLMNQLGLPNVKYFSPRIGEASQVKMIRSVFSKGVECLLLEMLIAGKRAGINDYLWKDINDFMTKDRFEKVAENWIRTHPQACERRYHEVIQVMGTLEEMNIDPVMTRGTRDFLERSWRMGLRQSFPTKPASLWDVASRLEEGLKRLEMLDRRRHRVNRTAVVAHPSSSGKSESKLAE